VLTIRSYSPADFENVVALWQACELTRPWNDPAADIEFCVGSENSILMVGVAGDEPKIVATAMAGHNGHRGWIYYVAVDPQHRDKGAGREIMEGAEEWLAEKGVPKAMLMIRETNRQVVGFYKRLGYTVEERVVMARWLKKPRHA
jgi:ribosomal protein S18 acetylase RimI-like enzyme